MLVQVQLCRLYAVVPQWWRSCLEGSGPAIPACRFESCVRRSKGMCANRAGSLSRTQVIRKGLGVRIPPSSLLSRFGRIGKCTCLLSRGRLVRHPGAGPGSGVQINNGRYANWMKQAVCKTVALGLVGSSPTLPTICRSPSNGGGAAC